MQEVTHYVTSCSYVCTSLKQQQYHTDTCQLLLVRSFLQPGEVWVRRYFTKINLCMDVEQESFSKKDNTIECGVINTYEQSSPINITPPTALPAYKDPYFPAFQENHFKILDSKQIKPMLTIASCGVRQIREGIKGLIISSLSYLDKHVPNDTVGPCIETQDFSHFISICSVLVCYLLKLSFGILKPLPSFLMSKHYVEINSLVTPKILE